MPIINSFKHLKFSFLYEILDIKLKNLLINIKYTNMTKYLTKRLNIVRIIAYETLFGEYGHFLSIIFVSHYIFISFLSVLMSLDISVHGFTVVDISSFLHHGFT